MLGIVGTTFGVFIVPAITANQDLERRAALVDSAEIAVRRMARDIRIALPNSVRVSFVAGTGFAIEMIPTIDGGRYCLGGDANCASAPRAAANSGSPTAGTTDKPSSPPRRITITKRFAPASLEPAKLSVDHGACHLLTSSPRTWCARWHPEIKETVSPP